MSEDIQRWTSKLKSSLVIQTLKGKTSISEALRQYGFTPSEFKRWVDDVEKGMENALRSKPKDIRE